jgi:CheY-like chemotaxis protein
MRSAAKTILVVDDDKLVLATLKFGLEEHGYQVFVAENGIAALNLLEHQPIDLVVLDILMPEKDGLETLLEIRESFPSLPVYAMSAGTLRIKHDFLAVAKKFGAAGVIRKPVTPNQLIGIIEDLGEIKSLSPATG